MIRKQFFIVIFSIFLAIGEPVRGCSSDFANTNQCSTSETSTDDCYVCEGDACNSIIYPKTGRLQCHTCQNGDCQPSEDNLEYCTRLHQDERCASVFDATLNEVIGRGCISDLETQQRETCQQNNTNCLKCAYAKCNKDDSKLKVEFCIGCDSESEANCLKENSQLEVRCSTNQCYTRLTEKQDKFYGQHIERGCLSDLQAVTQCNSPDCRSCTGKNCNDKLFPANRISCKRCQSESCNGGAVDKICNLYAVDEACLTFYNEDDAVIFRDCFADAPTGTRELCNDPTNLQCTKCEGNLCNVDSRRRGNKCYKCEGIDCVNPGLPSVVDCLSECYVGVNSNGDPVRDCADAISNSAACGVADRTCLRCDEDQCNGVVYPTQDRLNCIKCLNDECQSTTTVSEYCERWNPNERCISVFDQNDAIIERGCLSSIQNTGTCSNSNPNCLLCNFNNCNVEKSVDEKYYCVSCNSGTDSKCVSDPKATQTVGCKSNMCFYRLLTANGIGQNIERGCSVDAQMCTGNPNCQLCQGERCNSVNFPSDRHSCFYCSGDHCPMGHLHEKQCIAYSPTNKNCVTVYGTGELKFKL